MLTRVVIKITSYAKFVRAATTALFFMRKYYENRGKKMLLISKEIAHKLNTEYGIPFKDEGISHTYSKNGRKYYLCESKRNKEALKKLLNTK